MRVSPEALWGLVGVLLGFLLYELAGWFRRRRRRRLLRKALVDECRSLLSQIPQLVDIYEQAIESLKTAAVLPGPAVAGISTVYRANLAELSSQLNERERNLLHVVFERARVGDELLANQARDLLRWQALGANPRSAYITQAEDQIKSYRVVELLLTSFLDGKPEDVFQVAAEKAKP